MDKKLKIALVGCGSIGGTHLLAYSKNPKVEIYALCDINEERLNAKADLYNVPQERRFTKLEDMVALPEIDTVSVCTWNNQHAPCTITALNAGKHVLCEKPMAMSAEEAETMKAAAEKNGKLLMIGFVRRYGNDCEITKEFVDNGFFGELYYAKATYLRRNGSPGGWFGDKSRSGGGPLIDLGVHVIDLVRYLMGNPKPVSVYGATFKKLGDRPGIKTVKGWVAASGDETTEHVFDVEDLASAMIRFDNGAVLSVEASFSLNTKSDTGNIELFGTKGGAKLSPELELYSEANKYMTNISLDIPTALDFNGLFEGAIDHFVDCVLTGEPCRSPAEDGVAIMKILDGIYKSAELGHEVVLD